jgi:Zn-dependent protease
MTWEERPWSSGSPDDSRAYMENPLSWAPTIGRIFGIRVRIHLLFILYIFFELITASPFYLFKAQLLTVLFGSVFLHELGHCFAARYVGGSADQVLMWPLGGLAYVDAPRAPWPQFVTVVCGPLVNVAILLVAMLLQGMNISFNPFDGWGGSAATLGDPQIWLYLAFKLNLVLFLFNLWPMYPMDGGRMLQCALWKWMGYRRAMLATTSIGMICAILLGFWGLTKANFMMIAIAFMGYMQCMQERQMAKAMSIYEQDADIFASSANRGAVRPQGRAGFIQRLKQKWQSARASREESRQVIEQLEIDRILDKVHRQGIASLSRAEKQFLEETTQRQKRETSGRR